MKRVYFIRAVNTAGPVKIGCSRSPDRRRSSLETWCPYALEIIAEIEGGHDIERRFHAFFIADHLRREWFNWSPAMAETVAAINAGTFDISKLPEAVGVAGMYHGRTRPRTAAQRLQLSYSLRCTHMQRRSGYELPFRYHNVASDPELRARMDAYLADPVKNGVPIKSEWAAKRRRQFAAAA